MKKYSTFLNNISGDKKLNLLEKIYWLAVSFINILFPNNSVDKRIKIINFNIKKDAPTEESKTNSPSRFLSDCFWHSFPWTRLKNEIGEKINAIEIGCGTGKYGIFLQGLLGDNLNSYLGLDIKENADWKISSESSKINFVIDNSYNATKYLEGKNLIFTQSSIEHFKEDILFFQNLSKYLSRQKEQTIQIHLMPSSFCLFTYLFHGYRHYNLRLVSKITEVFNNDFKFTLFNMGSANANMHHLKNITIPKILNKKEGRHVNSDKYFELMKQAIKLDQKSPKKNNVSFYALIIAHNFDKDFF